MDNLMAVLTSPLVEGYLSAGMRLAIPIMLVFAFGALWKRATNAAATLTFIVVAPFVAVPFVRGNPDTQYLDLPLWNEPVHLFNFAFGLWLVAAAFMFVVSLATRAPAPEAVAPYIWTPAVNRLSAAQRSALRWYQRIGLWSVLAAIMFVLIYITYW